MGKYNVGYKFRIYPNCIQQQLISRTIGCCRFVYNHFLIIRRDEWRVNHNSLNYAKTNRLLTDLKKRDDTLWLLEADSMALQNSLRDLDSAYQNFFKKRAGYPRFKSKHSHNQSYRTNNGNKNTSIRIVDKRIRLPKIGFVKIKQSQKFEGRILNATISHTASGKYFVSLCVEMDKEKLSSTNNGKQIGIDVGLKEFYTDSNGTIVANPRVLKKLSKKLARERRRLYHKMPNSKNREKARIRVARVYEHITNIRKDFLHKLSTQLTRENQTIAVEHLNIKRMLKNHRLARSISDVSWGEFFRQLEYKAKLHGGEVIKVDTFYPSSQICSNCGYKNSEIKNLSIRKWVCPKCGAHHDRDINAAKNILRKALEEKQTA